jgi:hypothetical protein
MQRFFRSDTRKPTNGIDGPFDAGFSNRMPRDPDKEWFQNTLNNTKYAPDAKNLTVISLSSHLESAALFPYRADVFTSYIYVMFLPIPTKFEIKGDKLSLLPSEVKFRNRDMVMDLNYAQTVFACNTMKAEIEKNPLYYDDNIAVFAGGSLCAYESFAYHVPSKNIYCAIEIKQEKTGIDRNLHCNYGEHQSISWFEKEFAIKNIIFNPHFKDSHTYLLETKEKLHVKIDPTALKEINKFILKKSLKTPSPSSGLGGKILPVPVETSMEKFSKVTTAKQKLWLDKNLYSGSLFACHLLTFYGKNPQEILLKFKKNHAEDFKKIVSKKISIK